MTAHGVSDIARERGVDGLRLAWDAAPVRSKPETGAAKPRIVHCEELAGKPVPIRRWLVPDWIPWGVVTGLYGDGGMGKTLLAQQLMTACATGRLFVGLSVARVRSLGIFCEDAEDELHRRQDDINRHIDIDFDALASMAWMPRFGDDNILVRFTSRGQAEVTAFYGQVEEAILDLRAELVVVDTAADTFGGNENDRGQVRYYVSTVLGGLARRINGTVVVCAHPSRAGLKSGEGDGGSTGWSNAFRSRLFLHPPPIEEGSTPPQDERILSRKKANYAARNDEVKLTWHKGFLVVDGATGSSAGMQHRDADRVFLDLLDRFTDEGRPLSPHPNAGNYAPKVFAGQPDAQGYKKGDFNRAMQSLFKSRQVRLAEYGRKSDQRWKIARAQEASE